MLGDDTCELGDVFQWPTQIDQILDVILVNLVGYDSPILHLNLHLF
jgi:hypothetical protein